MKVKLKVEKEVEAKFLKVYAGVRYWDDAEINGETDTEDGDNIPCKEGDSWNPIIDLDKGLIINWEKGKIASLHYKVCDAGTYKLTEENGDIIAEYDGYVPDILCPDGEGYGDYIIMSIDENGYIQNWEKECVYNDFETLNK